MKLLPTDLAYVDDGPPQFAVDTKEDQMRCHCILLAIGKSKSGKTFFLSHLLKWLEFDIVCAITPTYESNSGQFKKMGVRPEHVFNPDDPEVVSKITRIVDQERDDLVRYREMKQISKELKAIYGTPSRLGDMHYLFSEYVDAMGRWKKIEHQWNGRRARIAVCVDDAQSSNIFLSRKFLNLCTRHRHVGCFETDEPSLGISLFIACQNYTSTGGGLPRAIRGNATHLALWRTKNAKELKLISEEMAGEVSPEKFLEVYNYVMQDEEDKYAMMFVDLHKKDSHPSMFRKNYTHFIVLD